MVSYLMCISFFLFTSKRFIAHFLPYLPGSSGCHVYDVDVFSMDFYSRLGFVELKNVTRDQEVVYFGRIF